MNECLEKQYRQRATITRVLICVLLFLIMYGQKVIYRDIKLLLRLYQSQNESCNSYKYCNENNNKLDISM
jgi:hypothetical protein|nr:MAG TPA: hypothetical protein [Caudoviricetes sp.]